MNYEVESDSLVGLLRGESDGAWPTGIGKLFRRRIRSIGDAPDERMFYDLKSWHFEKLQGDRSRQYSIRLNKQYRLIVELRDVGDGKMVAVKGIEDYH